MRRATILTIVVALLLALTASVAVAETIKGTARGETLRGTNEADTIGARGGNDDIRGRGGNDKINAGTGDDTAYGMDGDDRVTGGSNNDDLNGGAGSDLLKSHLDKDADGLNCGPGNGDTAIVGSNDSVDGREASTMIDNAVAPVTSCETIKVFLNDGTVITIGPGGVVDNPINGGLPDLPL